MGRFREQMAGLFQMGVFERAVIAQYTPPMPVDDSGQPLPSRTF